MAASRARQDLNHAFGKWDDDVASMHMAWIVVRRAEKHLREADDILKAIMDDIDEKTIEGINVSRADLIKTKLEE